jgi:hypothetical protein
MRFKKIPYYLRYSIDEIIVDARKSISVHYLHNIVHTAGKTASKGGTWCQINDATDYSQYFYEPKKFIMLKERTIRSLDQRSAHQNAIIAFKKWEEEIREFLSNPERNNKISDRNLKMTIGHPTPPAQVRAVLKNSSRLQKTPLEKVHQDDASRS